MQVRVFEAENMQAALRRVKQELGPQAIIISTRTVRKGKAGILNKPKLEVTAALEAESGQEISPEPQVDASVPKETGKALAQATYSRQQPESVRENPARGAENLPGEERKGSEQGRAGRDSSMELIQGELAELRRMVKDLRASNTGAGARPTGQGSGDPRREAEAGDPVLDTLLARGIEWEAACRIAVRLQERYGEQLPSGNGQLREGISSVLAELVRVRDPLWDERQPKKRRVALLGPTGVGKTTTLAKLAASYLSRVSPKVALITVDNYRIAAVEQLRIYAEIMNIPLEVVTTQGEIDSRLARHEDKDLILVDTAGRSPQDEASLQELSGFLSPETGLENHLLLAASTREQDMQRSIDSFQALGLHGLVFTKMDECEDYGALFNIHYRNEYPLSYFTIGQKVPEDLMAADGRYLAERIIEQQREASDVHFSQS